MWFVCGCEWQDGNHYYPEGGSSISSRADAVARVTRSTGDSVPGARAQGTACLGSSIQISSFLEYLRSRIRMLNTHERR